MVISRRAVVNGMGQSATVGALVAALPTGLSAAQAAGAPAPAAAPAATTTYCFTRIYRPEGGATFNADMFRDNHLPEMIKAYGKVAERIELRVPPPPVEGQAAPQIIATVSIWFRDVAGFSAKHQTTDAQLAASMAKITTNVPITQVDEVLASIGDDRISVPLDSLCISSYFPTKEGGTIDTAYFAKTFYPKFVELYGTEAIRRIEVSKAATPKSQVVAATHVYIRDPEAYDAAAPKVVDLLAEAKPYTNIVPLQTLTKLHAMG